MRSDLMREAARHLSKTTLLATLNPDFDFDKTRIHYVEEIYDALEAPEFVVLQGLMAYTKRTHNCWLADQTRVPENCFCFGCSCLSHPRYVDIRFLACTFAFDARDISSCHNEQCRETLSKLRSAIYGLCTFESSRLGTYKVRPPCEHATDGGSIACNTGWCRSKFRVNCDSVPQINTIDEEERSAEVRGEIARRYSVQNDFNLGIVKPRMSAVEYAVWRARVLRYSHYQPPKLGTFDALRSGFMTPEEAIAFKHAFPYDSDFEKDIPENRQRPAIWFSRVRFFHSDQGVAALNAMNEPVFSEALELHRVGEYMLRFWKDGVNEESKIRIRLIKEHMPKALQVTQLAELIRNKKAERKRKRVATHCCDEKIDSTVRDFADTICTPMDYSTMPSLDTIVDEKIPEKSYTSHQSRVNGLYNSAPHTPFQPVYHADKNEWLCYTTDQIREISRRMYDLGFADSEFGVRLVRNPIIFRAEILSAAGFVHTDAYQLAVERQLANKCQTYREKALVRVVQRDSRDEPHFHCCPWLGGGECRCGTYTHSEIDRFVDALEERIRIESIPKSSPAARKFKKKLGQTKDIMPESAVSFLRENVVEMSRVACETSEVSNKFMQSMEYMSTQEIRNTTDIVNPYMITPLGVLKMWGSVIPRVHQKGLFGDTKVSGRVFKNFNSKLADPNLEGAETSEGAYKILEENHKQTNAHHPDGLERKQTWQETYETCLDLLSCAMRNSTTVERAFFCVRDWMTKEECGLMKLNPKYKNCNPMGIIAFLTMVKRHGIADHFAPQMRRNSEFFRVKARKLIDQQHFRTACRDKCFLPSELAMIKAYSLELEYHQNNVNSELRRVRMPSKHDKDKESFGMMTNYTHYWGFRPLAEHTMFASPSGDAPKSENFLQRGMKEMSSAAIKDALLDPKVQSSLSEKLLDSIKPEMESLRKLMGKIDSLTTSAEKITKTGSEILTKVDPLVTKTETLVDNMTSENGPVDKAQKMFDKVSDTFDSANEIMDRIRAKVDPALQEVTLASNSLSSLTGIIKACVESLAQFIPTEFKSDHWASLPLEWWKNCNFGDLMYLVQLFVLYVNCDSTVLKTAFVFLALKHLGILSLVMSSITWVWEELKKFATPTDSDGSAVDSWFDYIGSIFENFDVKKASFLGGILVCTLAAVKLPFVKLQELGSMIYRALQNIHWVGLGLFGAKRIFEYIGITFQTVTDYIKKNIFGIEAKDNANRARIFKWVSRVRYFITEAGIQKIRTTQKALDEAKLLYNEGTELLLLAHQDPNFCTRDQLNLLKETQRHALLIQNLIYRITTFACFQYTMFHIQLYGPAGIGKSSITAALAYALRDRLLPTHPREALIYPISNLDHWDGYFGQPILIGDDLFQYDDPVHLCRLISLVTNTPIPVPMANLSDKGMYMTSLIMISSTNNAYPVGKGIFCLDAIHRRRHALLEVFCDQRVIDPSTHKYDEKRWVQFYGKACEICGGHDRARQPCSECTKYRNTFPHLTFSFLKPVQDHKDNIQRYTLLCKDNPAFDIETGMVTCTHRPVHTSWNPFHRPCKMAKAKSCDDCGDKLNACFDCQALSKEIFNVSTSHPDRFMEINGKATCPLPDGLTLPLSGLTFDQVLDKLEQRYRAMRREEDNLGNVRKEDKINAQFNEIDDFIDRLCAGEVPHDQMYAWYKPAWVPDNVNKDLQELIRILHSDTPLARRLRKELDDDFVTNVLPKFDDLANSANVTDPLPVQASTDKPTEPVAMQQDDIPLPTVNPINHPQNEHPMAIPCCRDDFLACSCHLSTTNPFSTTSDSYDTCGPKWDNWDYFMNNAPSEVSSEEVRDFTLDKKQMDLLNEIEDAEARRQAIRAMHAADVLAANHNATGSDLDNLVKFEDLQGRIGSDEVDSPSANEMRQRKLLLIRRAKAGMREGPEPFYSPIETHRVRGSDHYAKLVRNVHYPDLLSKDSLFYTLYPKDSLTLNAACLLLNHVNYKNLFKFSEFPSQDESAMYKYTNKYGKTVKMPLAFLKNLELNRNGWYFKLHKANSAVAEGAIIKREALDHASIRNMFPGKTKEEIIFSLEYKSGLSFNSMHTILIINKGVLELHNPASLIHCDHYFQELSSIFLDEFTLDAQIEMVESAVRLCTVCSADRENHTINSIKCSLKKYMHKFCNFASWFWEHIKANKTWFFTLLTSAAVIILIKCIGKLFNPTPVETSRVLFKHTGARPLIGRGKHSASENFMNLAEAVLTRNVTLLQVELPDRVVTFNGTRSGHYIYTCFHSIRKILHLNNNQPFKLHYFPTQSATSMWNVMIRPDYIAHHPRSDFCVIYSPEIPEARNIDSYYYTDADFAALRTNEFCGLYYNDRNFPTLHVTKPTSVATQCSPLMSDGNREDYTRVIEANDMLPQGSSGSPLLSTNERIQGARRICGVMSYNLENNAYIQGVTREMIQLCKSMVGAKVDHVPLTSEDPTYAEHTDSPRLKPYITEHMDIVGEVPRVLAAGSVGTTKIVKTEFHKHLSSVRVPAVLSKSDPAFKREIVTRYGHDFKLTHPLAHSINKFSRDIMQPFTFNRINQAVKDITLYIKHKLKHPKLVPLDFHDSIRGTDHPCSGSIDLSTSPGQFWVSDRFPNKPSGKKAYIQWDDDGQLTYVSLELRAQYNTFYSKLRQGIVPSIPWYEFPKDELRPSDKAYGNNSVPKTRSISVNNMSMSLLFRSFHLDLTAHMHDAADGTFQSCVGINPDGPEWSKLYMSLASKSITNCFDLDVGNWDGHMTPQLFRACVTVVNSMYGDDDASPDGTARFAIAHQAVFGYDQWEELIFKKMRGMPSGFGGTALYNTLAHMLVFYMLYLDLCESNNKPECANFNYYYSNVAVFFYGDDVVASVSDEIAPWFNGVTLAELYSHYGWPTTTASKDGERVAFQPIQDVQFLKRHFVVDPQYGVRVVHGKIDFSVIVDLFSWIRVNSRIPRLEQFEQNRLEAACFLVAYGREIYDDFIGRTNSIGSQYGYFPFMVSYDQLRDMLLTNRFAC